MINPEKLGVVAYTEAVDFGAWRPRGADEKVQNEIHLRMINGISYVPARIYGPKPRKATIMEPPKVPINKKMYPTPLPNP